MHYLRLLLRLQRVAADELAELRPGHGAVHAAVSQAAFGLLLPQVGRAKDDALAHLLPRALTAQPVVPGPGQARVAVYGRGRETPGFLVDLDGAAIASHAPCLAPAIARWSWRIRSTNGYS